MGKRNSARSRARHTILADVLLLEGESRDRFAALLNSLIAEFDPQTEFKLRCIRKIANAEWPQRADRGTRVGRDAATRPGRFPAVRSRAAMESMRTAAVETAALARDTSTPDLTSRYEHRFNREHAVPAPKKIAGDQRS